MFVTIYSNEKFSFCGYLEQLHPFSSKYTKTSSRPQTMHSGHVNRTLSLSILPIFRVERQSHSG